MQRAIITVVGKDTIGIIAGVCTYLAENHINILDISQTIVQGYFNMMMIVDVTTLDKPFGQVADELATLGQDQVPEGRDLQPDAQDLKRGKGITGESYDQHLGGPRDQ